VPEKATQGAETQARDWRWVEASGCSERLLAAFPTPIGKGSFRTNEVRILRKTSDAGPGNLLILAPYLYFSAREAS
jgi:hypothetical protein